MHLAVIIPTYNERENLPELIYRIENCLKKMKDFEIIIVDDNSPDGTGEIAEDLAKSYSNIKVVHRPRRMGLASAIIDGLRHTNAELIAVMDADLQHPPELLPILIDKMINDDAEVVIASRYCPGGSVGNWSLLRQIISKVATKIARILIPRISNVSDPLSGYFVVRKDVIENVNLNPIGMKILLEILAKGKYSKVCEVPYKFLPRERGRSKLNLGTYIQYLKHVFKIAKETGEVLRFLKFCTVGLSGILVNEGLLWVLTELMKIYYIISSLISVEVSILSNFTFNELWTFKDRIKSRRARKVLMRIMKYNIVSLGGLVINVMTLWFLTSFCKMHYLISNIFGIILATAWNYSLSVSWAWQS